ncbi:MAG: ABC-ATPase domain-containing protein [Opitutaceae bacterium]|nr:ABC-ATPase domain-containing protein [Opitutaceae bacterium]
MTSEDLYDSLRRLDGKPYPAYKDIKGSYEFDNFTLSIDRVQGDPFASPSRLSIRIDHSHSLIDSGLFSNASRRTGSETFLALAFSSACHREQTSLGSGKSGKLEIDTPGQEILKRTCVEIGETETTVHFSVGLPANGRRILGKAAIGLLTETLPEIVSQALVLSEEDKTAINSFADTNEDADHLRSQLEDHRLVAFIADGATLPRASGIDQHPLSNAVPFQSPASQRICLTVPHAGEISGMGISDGITLIVGGGYHGKSTLLNALERGVYNHIPGDGRECVVALNDATKVRAEDGRSVASVDLSPFINNLPGGKNTQNFTTENASGSTSQAASIIETLETGSHVLLIDEDISATNFLIRDARMQQLIAPEKEPITPFVQRVRALYDQYQVSTILVLGGSGDYFEPAHRVIAMDNYLPHDLTPQAKALCANDPSPTHCSENSTPFEIGTVQRFADPSSINPYKHAAPYRGSRHGGHRQERAPRKNIKAQKTRSLLFGTEEIDLSLLAQLVNSSQTRTIGAALAYACENNRFNDQSIIEALNSIITLLDEQGLSILDGNDLAEIRIQEFMAALNRLRSLRIE